MDEANRIWSKAQDSVKHKYARILKNNEKQTGFCPEENYVSKYDRQMARNVCSLILQGLASFSRAVTVLPS